MSRLTWIHFLLALGAGPLAHAQASPPPTAAPATGAETAPVTAARPSPALRPEALRAKTAADVERPPRSLRLGGGPVRQLHFTPQGDSLLASTGVRANSFDDRATIVRRLDLASGRTLSETTVESKSREALTSDGRWLLSYDDSASFYDGGRPAGSPRHAVMKDAQSGQEVRRFVGHTDGIKHMHLDVGAQRLFTVSHDQSARLWDVATGKVLARWGVERPGSAAVSPDGSRAVVVVHSESRRTALRVIDLVALKPLRDIPLATSARALVYRLVVAPDNRRLALNFINGALGVHLFDLESGSAIGVCRSPIHVSASSMAFSPDGTSLAIASVQGVAGNWDSQYAGLEVWDGACRAQYRDIRLTTGRNWGLGSGDAMAWSPDGRTLAYGLETPGGQGAAELWDLTDFVPRTP